MKDKPSTSDTEVRLLLKFERRSSVLREDKFQRWPPTAAIISPWSDHLKNLDPDKRWRTDVPEPLTKERWLEPHFAFRSANDDMIQVRAICLQRLTPRVLGKVAVKFVRKRSSGKLSSVDKSWVGDMRDSFTRAPFCHHPLQMQVLNCFQSFHLWLSQSNSLCEELVSCLLSVNQ